MRIFCLFLFFFNCSNSTLNKNKKNFLKKRKNDISSMTEPFIKAVKTILIPHSDICNLAFRDCLSQICSIFFKSQSQHLDPFFKYLHEQMQTKSTDVRLLCFSAIRSFCLFFFFLKKFHIALLRKKKLQNTHLFESPK